MKNLTEFPGFLLRRASAVRREKLQELLAAAKTVAAMPEPDSDAPAGDSSETPDRAAGEAVASGEAGETASVSPGTSEEADKSAEPAGEADKAETSDKSASAEKSDKPADNKPKIDEQALAAAVGEVMKVADERLTYLMGALQAVGNKGMDKVRQVRVFKGEEGPSGAFSIDDLHFVVDRVASPAKKSSGDKGRGKGRGNKGGGGGGGGFKPSSPKAGQGFDSMAKDERPGDVPSGGYGWSLERAPGSDKDKRGPGKGKPGRKGPRKGKSGKPGGRSRSGGNKKAPEVVVKATTVAPSDK